MLYYIKPNFGKIRIIYIARKSKVLNDQHRLGNTFIMRKDCIKALGVHTECKLNFHIQSNY